MFEATKRLIGIAIAAGLAASGIAGGTASAMEDDEILREISLQCPEAGGGTLQLTSMNRLGQGDRITIVYDGDLAVRIDVAAMEANGEFGTYITSSSPQSETDADRKEFIETVLAKYGILRRGVCLAPKSERDRYFRVLARTKRDLQG
jgi:hypothetical protein